jgi:hypothetical protein
MTTGTGTTAVAGAELVAEVRAGRHAAVPALLERLDGPARKALLPELKELRKEVRRWDWNRWRQQEAVRRALWVAGAGCHTGPAAAAAWIGSRELAGWSDRFAPLVLAVLEHRDTTWLGEVARRLAEHPAAAEEQFRLVHDLVVRTGCAVPVSEGYLRGWTRTRDDRDLLDRLRADPHTPLLVPRVIELTETPDVLAWSTGPDQQAPWPAALKALADEGVLDRAVLADGCLSRLLRGGRPRDLRFPLALLQALGTTAQERSGRVADWLGMAADGPSPVAGYAQQVLGELALEGGLGTRELAEMSGAVLFRTEKKLVRAQLTLLGKVLRKDPGAAAELLPVITDAFGNEDTTIQERALALVGRHLAGVDEAIRAELAGSVELLSPVHRAAAAELFGVSAPATDVPYEEILPPVPEPAPVAPPAETIAELVADLVALERHPYGSLEEFERALDGLVRHAHQDREALTAAAWEAFSGSHWLGGADHTTDGSRGVQTAIAGLLGTVRAERIDAARRRPGGTPSCAHEALTRVIDARVWEAAWLLMSAEPVPFLLATPTLHTGSIEPRVLVERLRGYRDAGVEPLPLDLAQALLRVRKADPSAAEAAGEAAVLDTRAGTRLAAWLTAEDSLTPTLRLMPRGDTARSGQWWLADRLVVAVREREVVREEFPPAFAWLGGSRKEIVRGCHQYHWSVLRPLWPGVLPDDRETLAAWLLPSVAGGADWEERGATEGLTALAEADGPVGPAVHLSLAVGLGARHAEDRLTAVDALLVLASRGELDPVALGARLAELVAEGTVKPNRLADAARTAAATGAYATVLTVLRELLPGLLGAQRPVRGAGDLVAVAAECAERCGGSGEIAGLAETADRPGATQLVVQARRLRAALGYVSGSGSGSDQPTPEVV